SEHVGHGPSSPGADEFLVRPQAPSKRALARSLSRTLGSCARHLDEKTKVMSSIFRIGRSLTPRALCIASGEMALSSVHEMSCAPAAPVRETATTHSPITMMTVAQADEARTCRVDVSRANR